MIVQAAETLLQAGNGTVQFEGEPWNGNAVTLIRSAKGHLQLVLFKTFADSVAEIEAEVRQYHLACRSTCMLTKACKSNSDAMMRINMIINKHYQLIIKMQTKVLILRCRLRFPGRRSRYSSA